MLKKILESQKIKLYHGSNVFIPKIDPKYMGIGNDQEGIGIYFSDDLNVAKHYGDKISVIEVENKFVDSRKTLEEVLTKNKWIKFLMELFKKSDKEEFYYFITDYLYDPIGSPDEINKYVFEEAWDILKEEEIRNFQIALSDVVGVELFVNTWNKMIKIIGLVNEKDRFFSVIDTSVKIIDHFEV
jgi:hypothetical protein